MTDIKDEIKRLMELNAKRTKGTWFFSARTLRSEIRELDEDGDDFVSETPDILNVDLDKCIYAPREADARFIEAMANQGMPTLLELSERLRVAEEDLRQICFFAELIEKQTWAEFSGSELHAHRVALVYCRNNAKEILKLLSKRELVGWNISPNDIDCENEFDDVFNPISGHDTRNNGKKTMIIGGLYPDEFDAVKKLLTEGNNIPKSNEIEPQQPAPLNQKEGGKP